MRERWADGANKGTMCQAVANKMLETLKACTLFPRAKGYFERAASRGDCDAIWAYYSRITKERPDVGRGIRSSGGTPVESVRAQLEQLYQQHQPGNRSTRKP
jgi:hypothetical protein